MVFKIFKRRKDNSENPLHKWEKQVKKSKKIGKDQMDRFVSSSDMKDNFPSYCDPSFVEDRLETTSIGLNRYDENEIDEKGNENDLNDSSDTRQVDNLFSTVTEQERLYMRNQSDEYFPSHADSNEFGYNVQSFNNNNMIRNRSRMVDPSEDVETLGQDGAAVYLYNELLANPVLTCMTLPILPCLGLYVKKIHSDATKSKNLQSEYSEDMEGVDLSQSQDDDVSPIYSRHPSEDLSLNAEPTSPYGPGITNYSIDCPSIENDFPGSVEENYSGFSQEMQTGHLTAGMQRDGSYRKGKFWKR